MMAVSISLKTVAKHFTRIRIMYNPENLKVGDRVKSTASGWVGVVVGEKRFGKPESGMLRVQLSFGLTHDFYPSHLKRTT